MNSWTTTALPIVTLVLGYFGTSLNESRRNARAARLARELREAAAQLAVAEREAAAASKRQEWRDTFELENLVRAQASLRDFSGPVREVHIAHLDASRTAGGYGEAGIEENLQTALSDAGEAVASTIGLILDDMTRTHAAEAYRRATDFLTYRGSLAEARDRFIQWRELHQAGLDAVAARIREIYCGSVTRVATDPV